MAISNIEKVFTVFQGYNEKDVKLATRYIQADNYIEHNPLASSGINGLKGYIASFPQENYLKVVRAFEDSHFVFTQEDGDILGQNTFFDIFRFEDGLIAEHWVFSEKKAPQNESGHTQIDGPTEAQHYQDTVKNKLFMQEYYNNVHIGGNHSDIRQYFSGNLCIRHEPGVRDGVEAFIKDVESAKEHRSIDALSFVLGQGNFVFIVAKGSLEGNACAFVDLYRIENNKNVEHWGFIEKIPPPEQRKNDFEML